MSSSPSMKHSTDKENEVVAEMYFVCDYHCEYGFLYTFGHKIDYLALGVPAKFYELYQMAANYALKLTAEHKLKSGDVLQIPGLLFLVSDMPSKDRAKVVKTQSLSSSVSKRLRLLAVLHIDESIAHVSQKPMCSCCNNEEIDGDLAELCFGV